jgi:outer membrane protein OmpA-like peptidoglycan-associated protein
MNGDGKLDIVYNGSSFVVMWDPNGTTLANTLLFKRIPPTFNFGVRGLPLIANVYNDKTTGGKSTDLPEAVIINSASGSAGLVTAYNLNFNTAAGTATQHIWSFGTNDMSGSTGITAFDFDGNGMREIVYRDQSTLRIINGNLATPVNYATAAVSSATWGEYPIVADLNNDGQAEIAVTGNNMLQVFVSDQPGGIGGTDIYYVNRREDGSWDATVNAGAGINTAANELFPTFYESNLYFSSNGHEGLGGLDIYKFKSTGVENLGKPINSEKDDLVFSARDNRGFFSSNRYGSDDIFSYEYKLVKISINGEVTVDGIKKPGIKVTLLSNGNDGYKAGTILDSLYTDANGNYDFKVKPNRAYKLLIEDGNGNKSLQEIGANGYVNLNKDLGQFNFVTPKKEEPVIVSTKRTFASVIDSLKSVTKDFIMVHHDFDKVNIVKQDKKIYNELQDRLQDLRGVTIVVVSATDCIGSDEYNEVLSSRRTQKIKKDLSKYGGNNFVLMPVGEKQLIMDCSESDKDKNKQLENRYSYVFVIK